MGNEDLKEYTFAFTTDFSDVDKKKILGEYTPKHAKENKGYLQLPDEDAYSVIKILIENGYSISASSVDSDEVGIFYE